MFGKVSSGVARRPTQHMNRFYSMQREDPKDGGKVGESFKFVPEMKRDVWRDDGGETLEEPSCCLSVSKISYTVR